MKKLLVIFLAVYLLITPVFAHAGRTDSRGGHYDRSTGEYHYHHGYPAHQHTNGYCPYDFDDQTGANSGSSSIGSKKSAETNSEKSEKGEIDIPWELFLYMAIPFLIWGYTKVDEKIRQKSQEKKQRLEERAKYQEEKKKYTEIYGGHSCEELSGMPDGLEIGEDGFPKPIGVSGWGEEFTFYVSPSGKAIHKKYGCSNAFIAVHICQVKPWRSQALYSPCQKCCSSLKLPNLTWYDTFCEIKAIKEKYEIDTGEMIASEKTQQQTKTEVSDIKPGTITEEEYQIAQKILSWGIRHPAVAEIAEIRGTSRREVIWYYESVVRNYNLSRYSR